MLFAAPLVLVGLLLGLLIGRWRAPITTGFVGLVVTVIGGALGWFADSEIPAAGGAILFGLYFWLPTTLGLALGVHLRRSTRPTGRPKR